MEDYIEHQFQCWLKSFAEDPAKYDHEVFIASLPNDAAVKPAYLARMLDKIFQESANELHANQLAAATDEMCRTKFIPTIKASPELHVCLIQALLINAHFLYRYGQPGDTTLPSLYKHLKDRSLREWTHVYSDAEINKSRTEWFPYISETYAGRAWGNLSVLYDMREIETQDLAALMPTVFPVMLAEFRDRPLGTTPIVPNDISFV